MHCIRRIKLFVVYVEDMEIAWVMLNSSRCGGCCHADNIAGIQIVAVVVLVAAVVARWEEACFRVEEAVDRTFVAYVRRLGSGRGGTGTNSSFAGPGSCRVVDCNRLTVAGSGSCSALVKDRSRCCFVGGRSHGH